MPNGHIDYDIERQKRIIYTMATCHSLRVVDCELLGDPLDVKMFQFTGWSYEEGDDQASEHPHFNHSSITPAIARPPSSTTGTSGHQQGSPNVSSYVPKNSTPHSSPLFLFPLLANANFEPFRQQ